MMLILLCLGIGIISAEQQHISDLMDSKPAEATTNAGSSGGSDTEVEEVYNRQKQLEEEDLLARLPGEEEVATVNPDILDTSMEDVSTGSGSKPNPTEGGEEAGTGTNTGSKSNPPTGDLSTKTGPNPTRGGDGLLNTKKQNVENKITPQNLNKGAGSVDSNNKLNRYLAANSKNKTSVVPNLNKGGGYILTKSGSFLLEGDNRFNEIHIESDVRNGTNTSYSFNPNTMECGCCGSFKNRKENDPPLVWVFADQNFSPILPASEGGGAA
jgi:hypothetical protein